MEIDSQGPAKTNNSSPQFAAINPGFNRAFKPGVLTLGLFFPIESYKGSIPVMLNQLELAQLAEDAGFRALWFRDVPLHDPMFGDAGQVYDPWVYMSYIGSSTKEIALASGSIVMPLRHPIHVAKSASSIDQLFRGRLILGIGAGDRPVEYPAFGRKLDERKQLFRESLYYLRALNNEHPQIENVFGRMSGNADLIPKSFGRRLPLLVTGYGGGQTLEWIAEHSDGWIYYPRDFTTLGLLVQQWRQVVSKISDHDKPFIHSFYLDLASDPDEPPVPIHLGYRLGRNVLLQFLKRYQECGVNHIIINLKYGRRAAKETLTELAAYVIPNLARGMTKETNPTIL